MQALQGATQQRAAAHTAITEPNIRTVVVPNQEGGKALDRCELVFCANLLLLFGSGGDSGFTLWRLCCRASDDDMTSTVITVTFDV
jgi:hypothetical protein